MLFGITPEEIISENLIEHVETAVKERSGFLIKIVAEGVNPALILKGALGFYPRYGMAFVSNPDKDSGLSAIDVTKKRLIFNPNQSAFHSQRDSVVYIVPNYCPKQHLRKRAIQRHSGRI